MPATQKSLEIQIALADLEALKADRYRLCFAKAGGNVVWQAYDGYLEDNSFGWTPVYQMFGITAFRAGATVTTMTATNVVDIGLGEKSTLDSAGVLGPAVKEGQPSAITMVNNNGTIHPVLNQESTSILGQQTVTPMMVSEIPVLRNMTETITPFDRIMAWFEQNIVTSTMFADARPNPVIVDMTATDSQTRRYADGKWTTPG